MGWSAGLAGPKQAFHASCPYPMQVCGGPWDTHPKPTCQRNQGRSGSLKPRRRQKQSTLIFQGPQPQVLALIPPSVRGSNSYPQHLTLTPKSPQLFLRCLGWGLLTSAPCWYLFRHPPRGWCPTQLSCQSWLRSGLPGTAAQGVHCPSG